MTSLMRACAAGVLALVVFSAGCARKQDETARQLEETQKQLDEAKKQLAAAQGQAGTAASGAKAPVKSGSAPGGTTSSAAGYGTGDAAAPPASTAPAAPSAPAARPAPVVPEAAAVPPAPPKPKVHTLAAGTPISVRTIGPVSTKTSSVGEVFEATLSEPLVSDGYVIAPKGARVTGVVTSSDPGGRVKGVASISVGLRSIQMADGRALEIKTGSLSQTAKQSKGKDAMKVGIASGIGAAIGAIAGGGKGAAIGAGAGAAGGTGMVLATRGEPAVIPAESPLSFKLSAPVTVEEAKK